MIAPGSGAAPALPTSAPAPRTGPHVGSGVVFLGVPMAINVRDVLRTDAFRTLRSAGAEVHLFTPAAHTAEFRREFGAPGVHIHPLAAPRPRVFALWDAAMLKLHVLLLSLRCDTARIMIEPTLARSAAARLARACLRLVEARGQELFLRCTRALTLVLAPELYGETFRRHRPDLVVGTRVITMSGPRTPSSARYLDRHLLMSAARRGIPTMVLVSSWDNLTTSGFFLVAVDRITVWNAIMREQAVTIHGLHPDRVVITGAPQHDVLARAEPYRPRVAFLRELGLDQQRRLVVYTTGTEGIIPDEPRVLEVICRALERELADVQLLVRLHQLDRRERYAVLSDNPRVVFDQAGRAPIGDYHDRDFDRAEHERLADTLRHADVVVNAASSISIDAAAVGTPVVCVDFDARPRLPYHASITRFYDFTHQRPIVASGGGGPGALAGRADRRDPALSGRSRARRGGPCATGAGAVPRPGRARRPPGRRGHARAARARRGGAVTPPRRRLLVVAGGTRATASTRHRLWSYRPYLEREGVPLQGIEYTGGRIASGLAALAARVRFLVELVRHADDGDVVLVQKVLPPIALVRRWKRRGCRVVYDFDDALHECFEWGETTAQAARRRRRFDAVLDAASHVIAGSPPLAEYARRRNASVDVLYPSLERERFTALPARTEAAGPVIGWVGNDQSQIYLRALEPVLAAVMAAHPTVRLRVCSAGLPPLAGLPADRVELVPWSERGELEAVASFDLAVSPLATDPWSRSRGGRVSVLFSLAAGVPVVAAPGGGLEELVAQAAQDQPGLLFARAPADWIALLGRLLVDREECTRRGLAARALIDRYIWADVQYGRFRRALLADG